MVDTPEQRRMGIRDSLGLAQRDWAGSARFDRAENRSPHQWAKVYLDFAASNMRPWLYDPGMRWFSVVGWAEYGDGRAEGAWQFGAAFSCHLGHRPRCCRPFATRVRAHMAAGQIDARSRHQVSHIIQQGGHVTGVSGELLSPNRAPIGAFKKHGADFVVAGTLSDLLRGMNEIAEEPLQEAQIRAQIEARDAQVGNPFAKDRQIQAIHAACNYRGDRLIRVAKPHRVPERKHGPLIAVRLSILTRKTLSGLHTDLHSQMLGVDGRPLPGLFATGEASGFGGGGYHGYNALEVSFLGGCLFSGRQAGRSDQIA